MIYVKDEICEAIQKHNKFIPCYNTLTEAHECLTDYELVTTLYREKIEINRALEEANKLKTPVFVGEIGPGFVKLLNPIDFIAKAIYYQ